MAYVYDENIQSKYSQVLTEAVRSTIFSVKSA